MAEEQLASLILQLFVAQVPEGNVVVPADQNHVTKHQTLQPFDFGAQLGKRSEVRQIATVHEHVPGRQCRMLPVRVRNHDDLHREIALPPKERTTASSAERYTRLYSPPQDTESVA